jgi:hypothetical protein
MPTYHNTSESIRVLTGYPSLAPGETRAVWKYVSPLPDGVELVSHEPYTKTPTKLSDSLPSDDLTVVGYTSITIYNKTNADVSVSFNERDSDALLMPSGAYENFDCDNDILTVSITGSGTGDCYVWGYLK